MIGTVYRHLLPLCLRTAAGQCRNKIKQWWWRHQPIATVKWWCIRQWNSTARAHNKRQQRHRALLESGKVINVAFEVSSISKWKADSVLRLMMEHPRFNPIVWHIPYDDPPNPEQEALEIGQCEDYFPRMGVKLETYPNLKAFPADKKPDIIFINEPYNVMVSRPYHKGILKHLFCFLPYGFTSTKSPFNYNQVINNAALFAFYENGVSYNFAKEIMSNHGRNAVLSGQPFADSFLYPMHEAPQVWKDCSRGMKRVIWAPHWSITESTRWLVSFGTFLKTAEAMMELARAHVHDIQFAFKPHPNLYSTLCKHPEWGKEKTDAFYAKWREMRNAQLETGEYVDLFMQSDAMIHDCGSFIQEYLFADKPCMYLRDGSGYQGYSDMAADCLNAYQIGITREEIEEFLQMLLRGEDPKAEVRRELREKYLVPPNGQSAAQNIIDCLLNAEID